MEGGWSRLAASCLHTGTAQQQLRNGAKCGKKILAIIFSHATFCSVYNTTLAFLLIPTRSCSYLLCSCSSHVSLFRGFGRIPQISPPPPHPWATGLEVMIFWTHILQIVLGISILSFMTTRGNTELYSVSCCSNLMEKIRDEKGLR